MKDHNNLNLHAQHRRGATKICNDCDNEFPEIEFLKWFSPQRKRMRRSPYCHNCRLARHKRRYLKRTYGMSIDDYDSMYKQQKGLCSICRRKPKKLFVDHDHRHGHVRSLLCINCNALIGQAQEDIKILRKAIAYVEKHKE